MKIDIGCGSNPKPGFIGVDFDRNSKAQYFCDFNTGTLPFPDNSVDEVFSSHCFEHLDPNSINIFKEISRVCKDGATIEIWVPYSWSNDALLSGHTAMFNETKFDHFTRLYPEHWWPIFGAAWLAQEYIYIIPEINKIKTLPFTISFCMKHFINIVYEIGVKIKIQKDYLATRPNEGIEEFYSKSRDSFKSRFYE